MVNIPAGVKHWHGTAPDSWFSHLAVEVKEIDYQAAAYLGIGWVFPFLHAANEVLTARGVFLPLELQATTTTENRLQAGEQTQIDVFGESFGALAVRPGGEPAHQPLADQ